MMAMKAKEAKEQIVRLDVKTDMPEKSKQKLVTKKRGRPKKQEV